MIGANQPLRLYRHTTGVERDELGRAIASYAVIDAFVGNLYETTSRELVDGQWSTVGTWVCLVPPGVTVTHRDVIEDGSGQRYRVQTATPRRGPTGKVRHTSCTCIRVEGA